MVVCDGIISSYDQKRRSGFIKELNTNKLYYFAKISVLDHTLKLETQTSVKFELHELDGRDPVAVRVRPGAKAPQPTLPLETKDHVTVSVVWFNMEKKYGFVRQTDDSDSDAFLHLNTLHKSGIKSVHPGQLLKVKFKASDHKACNAVDVIPVNEPKVTVKQEHHYTAIKQTNTQFGHSSTVQDNSFHSLASKSKSKPILSQHVQSQQLPQYKVQSRKPSHSGTPKKMVQSNIQHHFSPMSNPQVKKEHLYTPEQLELLDLINKKQSLLRTLDLKKLPDGGQRIKEQIATLQLKLQLMGKQTLAKPQKAPEVVKVKDSIIYRSSQQPQIVDLTNDTHYGIAAYGKTSEDEFPNTGEFYGGRMTTNRLNLVKKVTVDAIETLHSSLDTCPPTETELSDPNGLKVNLMTHQRQALAWLVWREKQSVSGGILADDMGLGKTLTMISLIMKQKELQKITELEEKVKVENLTKELSSCEISDGSKDKVNGEVKKEKDEPVVSKEEKPEVSECGATLIIAPASLIYHWEAEIKHRCKNKLLTIHLYHGNSREKDSSKLSAFDVVITTYDLVRRSYAKSKPTGSENVKPTKGKVGGVLFQVEWRRIILDEAHQIRNYKSQTSESVCALSAKSRWAMSGTPVQNQEADMYSMIKFLHCQPFNEYKLWKNQVDNKTQRGQQRMKTIVSCFVLRREKSQKGTDGKPLVPLPTRNFTTHKLKLNTIEQEVYNKLKSDSQSAFSKYEKWKRAKERGNPLDSNSQNKMTATTLIVMLLRLRQCCGHLHLLQKSFDPEILEKEKQDVAVEDLLQSLTIGESGKSNALGLDDFVKTDKAKHFEMSAQSSKIQFVTDRLKEIQKERPDDKCVVISQWTSMLKVLTYHLDKANFSHGIIEGSVSAQKRMELVEIFNSNPKQIKVMLISLQAGGVGLNLVGGNHLFLLDMHWNPALEKQAFDRIYRVGQRKEVFVHKFMMENTVEEQILQLQERKLSIAKAVMEGAVSENKVKLTLADMRMLFGLHGDRKSVV
uniref:Transcription termination factor 2-like n=1 Tax=Phallusia mammillata TaxID=59560 RepID=A0A6F9DWD4_9ASCI|nr:transcription termination factor 2-like [Phallusia mammillata]